MYDNMMYDSMMFDNMMFGNGNESRAKVNANLMKTLTEITIVSWRQKRQKQGDTRKKQNYMQEAERKGLE